jgi:uncharacterized membrane protein YedE/YeeE
MEHQFILSACGGALIGAAASALLLLDGKIAGISGILGNALAGARDAWRWAFLAGMVVAAAIAQTASLPNLPPLLTEPSWFYVIGGILVGIGTRVGSGCTSGHGVCGLANFSPRSLTATMLFMASAALTVFVVRHVVR